jgi:hypothetical protein
MNGLKIIRRSTGVLIGMEGGDDKLKKILQVVKPHLGELEQFESKWNHRTKCKEKTHLRDWWYESRANGFMSIHRAFENVLRHIPNVDSYVSEMQPVLGDGIECGMQDWFEYRDGQEDFVKFLASHPSHTRVLPANMGDGKTVSALASLTKIGRKAIIVIPASLKSEWLDSIEKFMVIDPSKYGFIDGSTGWSFLYDEVREGRTVPWDISVCTINSLLRMTLVLWTSLMPLDGV